MDSIEFSEKNHMSVMMMEMYKFMSHNSLCDMTVRVGDEVFNLHRCVFAASCPLLQYLVLKAMELSDDRILKVKLSSVSALGFKALMSYMYTGGYPKTDSPIELQREFIATCEILSVPYPVEMGGCMVLNQPNHDMQVALMPSTSGEVNIVLKRKQALHLPEQDNNEQSEVSSTEGSLYEHGDTFDSDVILENVPDKELTIQPQSSSYDHSYANNANSTDGPLLFPCSSCGGCLQEEFDEDLNKSGKIKYHCKHCSKTFITMKPKSFRKVTSSSSENSDFDEDNIAPEVKSYSFYSPDGIIRPYVCQLCGNSFTRRHSLKVHLETVCQTKSPVRCLGCLKVLSSKQSFNGHVRKFHPTEKPGCTNIEDNALRMSKAQKMKKIELKRYQCPSCAVFYKSHRHFLNHRKNCTKKTALKCPYCPKLFQVRKALQSHIWNHEKGSKT